ncbi:MAG: polyphosphate kinase 2 family protein, partial [Phycisphaerales bacterium]|nr:polyphosphate kinase 2 family protein [Phycisphaerales bacterium]
RDEQRKQLQERLDTPEKQWKFSPDDLKVRAKWNDYQEAYEDALRKCSTERAPWYVVPAERRWFRNLLVTRVIVDALESLDLRYPKPTYDPKSIRIDE